MKLTADILRAGTGCTPARAAAWLAPMQAALAVYAIDTPRRLSMFLANLGHESGRLVYVREIWGPTPAQTRYEGRVDLGNTKPGDGKRFLGRGLIQLTGRDNARACRDGLRKVMPGVPDFEADPTPLELPKWAALSACWFWNSKGLDRWADMGDFDGVCDVINRGLKTATVGDANGYIERLALWKSGRVAVELA